MIEKPQKGIQCESRHRRELALAYAARQWYRSPKRLYHNFNHAREVCAAVHAICSADSALLIAAMWHDAVYIPGAVHNEAQSMAALKLTSLKYGFDARDTVIMRAATLIAYTRVQDHMSKDLPEVHNPLQLESLLDADLSSLAAPWSKFKAYQRHLILETGTSVTADALEKNAFFLHRLMSSRRYIYRTPLARQFWEDAAYANITRWYYMQTKTRSPLISK
jgi:predicted metal-dependent HD superfamily phosphohydrolase